MSEDQSQPDGSVPSPALVPDGEPRRNLSPAAQRALAEAQARREQAQREQQAQLDATQKEYQGPKGPEPTRYGDWERKGIASDF